MIDEAISIIDDTISRNVRNAKPYGIAKLVTADGKTSPHAIRGAEYYPIDVESDIITYHRVLSYTSSQISGYGNSNGRVLISVQNRLVAMTTNPAIREDTLSWAIHSAIPTTINKTMQVMVTRANLQSPMVYAEEYKGVYPLQHIPEHSIIAIDYTIEWNTNLDCLALCVDTLTNTK